MNSTIDLKNFKHKMIINIRWSDMDAIGHVNNATYLTYLEEARICYLNDVITWDSKVDGIILASVNINYKKPIYFNQKIEILTRCSKIGGKSFELEYVMINELSEIICDGKTVMVYYNYQSNNSEIIPDKFRSLLNTFENKN